MARTLNKVMLIGNLANKPEVRKTTMGGSFCTFSLFTNREWVVDGQKREESVKHFCRAWDRLAEICGELLDKGNLVYIEGRLENHVYKDEVGVDKERTEIIVNEMIRLKRNEVQIMPEVQEEKIK